MNNKNSEKISINIDIDLSFFESMSKLLERQRKVFLNTAELIRNELNKIPDSIKNLAKSGWFIPLSLDPGSINHYSSLLSANKFEEVDKGMAELLDSETEYFENHIAFRFPHRISAIRAAINAHKRKEYYLSIPVFFAQSEGLCKELTSYRLFATKNKFPKTQEWVYKNFLSESFTGVLLAPLTQMDITKQLQIENTPFGINRHDILHGDSYDYGENSVNSYKALSLLFYISETVYDSNRVITSEL